MVPDSVILWGQILTGGLTQQMQDPNLKNIGETVLTILRPQILVVVMPRGRRWPRIMVRLLLGRPKIKELSVVWQSSQMMAISYVNIMLHASYIIVLIPWLVLFVIMGLFCSVFLIEIYCENVSYL